MMAALAFALPHQAQASGTFLLDVDFPDNSVETSNRQAEINRRPLRCK